MITVLACFLEAGEINKSLSQLALVIQRLTSPGGGQYVPYRDWRYDA